MSAPAEQRVEGVGLGQCEVGARNPRLAHVAAGLILPGPAVSGYYPALPENRTSLQWSLSHDHYGRSASCDPAQVPSMSDSVVERCWTAFHEDLEKTRADFYGRIAASIHKAFPPAGYWNEADWFEEDWQSVFWGDNYPRLLAVKRAVDPKGLFVCHHCVGSEGWTADGNCLLG